MQLVVTAKIQVSASPEQRALLDATLEAYRRACNLAADYVFQTHELKPFSLSKVLYRRIRNEYGLRSQMAMSVLGTVAARFKSILTSQHTWIKPKFSKPQYDLAWNRDYSLRKELFSVNTLSGRVKLPYFMKGMEQYFDGSWSFGTAKLVRRRGKYFLHIPAKKDIPDPLDAEVCNVVGIDRGVNFIAATYDSMRRSWFFSGRQIKQKRAKYKMLRRQLQRRRTPSARRRLKAIGRRENRWMQDINHQASKALVARSPKHTLFVLEDLSSIRPALEKVRRKNRDILVSWAYYDLEQKIRYKAARGECLVASVDPRYTSQACPVCGHVEKANRSRKLHLFKCRRCGYSSNDDRVGAMNLHRLGMNCLASGRFVPDAAARQHVCPRQGRRRPPRDASPLSASVGKPKAGAARRQHCRGDASPSALVDGRSAPVMDLSAGCLLPARPADSSSAEKPFPLKRF